jgi:hypothetical protein
VPHQDTTESLTESQMDTSDDMMESQRRVIGSEGSSEEIENQCNPL